MDIQLHEVTVRELYQGYTDNNEEGVVGYDGRLNIRPKYQREFVYNPKQRDAVINTIRDNYPLNTMYWVKTGEDEYELLDGQQRTVSICEYIRGGFALNHQFFHNLTRDEKEQILDYKLMVYVCEGTESQKLNWFRIINIAGEKLTDQELRNATYTGPWLASAKRYFSKSNGPAYNLASHLMSGRPIRQDYLETVIEWIARRDGLGSIEEYMSIHQEDTNANDLWLYFQSVVNWVNALFPKENYRREMKGLPWGLLYNDFSDNSYDSVALEEKVAELMLDDEVSKKKGIYIYIFDGKEKYLNLRSFTPKQRRQLFDRQAGVCRLCEATFEMNDMESDHIVPWSEGGKTSLENGQMLCKSCNREKSNT